MQLFTSRGRLVVTYQRNKHTCWLLLNATQWEEEEAPWEFAEQLVFVKFIPKWPVFPALQYVDRPLGMTNEEMSRPRFGGYRKNRPLH